MKACRLSSPNLSCGTVASKWGKYIYYSIVFKSSLVILPLCDDKENKRNEARFRFHLQVHMHMHFPNCASGTRASALPSANRLFHGNDSYKMRAFQSFQGIYSLMNRPETLGIICHGSSSRSNSTIFQSPAFIRACSIFRLRLQPTKCGQSRS